MTSKFSYNASMLWFNLESLSMLNQTIISSASVRSFHFCPLLCPSLHEISPWYHWFSWIDLSSFPFCCFPPFHCIDRWRRLSYLSLLFFRTLHSDAYIFPFLLCFSLLFFSQLFVRPPQTAILLFCVSFLWEWSWSLSPIQCHEPQSIVHQALYQI